MTNLPAIARKAVVRRDDPYRDYKTCHMADKIRADGAIKALCFKGNRALSLKRSLWTIRPEAVTCEKCRKILKLRELHRDDESWKYHVRV